MKRQEHTVNNKSHVSPQALSTDCCGESTNDAATLPSFSVAPRDGEHPKIVREHHFHRKKWKSDRFWPVWWPWPWPDPPPSTPLNGFSGQLANVILGGSPFKLTWQVDLTSCHLSSDLKMGRRRGWQVNLTSATCQIWLVKCFLSFFLRFRIPNLITGLSGWRAPD